MRFQARARQPAPQLQCSWVGGVRIEGGQPALEVPERPAETNQMGSVMGEKDAGD